MKVPFELKKYTESNRAAWNEVMPLHQAVAKEKWDRAFLQPNCVCLDEGEIGSLQEMGIQGKDVVHLCCNNGVELLSLKNLGARVCVGFDISEEAIKEAGERAQRCQIDCRFIRSDVYDIGAEYEEQFDVVYITAGCFGWLPDLQLFMEKAAALLRRNGRIFIHEIHPFSEMLPFDGSEEAASLRIVEPYFKKEPYADQGGLDYVGGSEYLSKTTQYWFVHTLSGILMSLINNRIIIEHFWEYEADISAGHRRIEEAKAGIPLSYILIGRKQVLTKSGENEIS
jgi:2-polyprenyl-3-methyl-5-hydroxy-6-metoxy-1,4-benzoquinol methylase